MLWVYWRNVLRRMRQKLVKNLFRQSDDCVRFRHALLSFHKMENSLLRR